MTFPKEHLDKHFTEEGDTCPFCGSRNTIFFSLVPCGASVKQDGRCVSCGKKWEDEYVLKHTRELED